MKYLKRLYQSVVASNIPSDIQANIQFQLPVVSLDLGNVKGMVSAMHGIMTQPSEVKICSLQALVLAMREAQFSSSVCDMLSEDLTLWIQHILLKKVPLQ